MAANRAAIAAAAVFVLGFGALAIASALGLGDPSLPGLTTFRSATTGDGVLLPLMAYVLVRSAGPAPHRRPPVVLAGLVGSVVGALSQVSWLINPAPRLNWSLPAPGTFNAVGWYHAAFLTAACGFFAALAVAALQRSRDAAGTSDGTIAALGSLSPALAFAGLLALDNGRSPALDIVVAATVFAAVLAWATRQVRWCVLICAAAAVPALSFSLLFLPGRIVGVVTVIPVVCAGMVGAFAASTVVWRDIRGRIVAPLCTALAAAGPVQALGTTPDVKISSLMWACAASLAATVVELLLIRSLLDGRAVRSAFVVPVAALPVTAYALCGLYFSQDPAQAGTYGVVVGVVAAFVFLFVTAEQVRVAFDAVVDAEVADVGRTELSAIKWSAYLAISTAYAGALLSCVVVLVGSTPPDRWLAGTGDIAQLWPLGLGLVAVVGIGRFTGRFGTPIACLAWTVLMGLQLTDGYGHWAQVALSVPMAVLTLLFVFEGVIANVGYLHGVRVDVSLVVAAAASALAAAVTTAWITGPALWSTDAVTSMPYALVTLVIGWAAGLLLPWMSARVMPGANPPEQHVIGRPVDGVLQDSFIVVLLATSVAWAPVLFLAHLNNVASWCGAVFPYFALLSRAYVYVMKNNIGHVHRERERIGGRVGEELPDSAERFLGALARHVSRQNRIALGALFPLGFLIVLSSEINGFDREGVRQIWRV